MKSFNAVMDALEALGAREDAAETARRLVEAAMADEDGAALEAALKNLRATAAAISRGEGINRGKSKQTSHH